MVALVSLLVVIALSLLITHIAAVALSLTGLSHEVARFQARSAFTGVGFTTREAEMVVNHPVRRRIVTLLMLLGNAGFVTAISSLVLTFISTVGFQEWLLRLLLLSAGLAGLWAIATSEWVDDHLSGLIGWALQRWSRLDTRDYANLLHLTDEYEVVELQVERGDWLANKTLAELDLHDEGVLVLGIRRKDGNYVGAPGGQTRVKADDLLILYGRGPLLNELDRRSADASGDRAHRQAVANEEHRRSRQAAQSEAN